MSPITLHLLEVLYQISLLTHPSDVDVRQEIMFCTIKCHTEEDPLGINLVFPLSHLYVQLMLFYFICKD